MQYEDVKKILPIYLEGELDPVENELVKKFLAQYPELQKEAHSLQRACNMLGEVKEIEPSEDYESRFWSELTFSRPWYEEFIESIKIGFKGSRLIPATVTACIVALVAIVSLQYFFQPQVTYQELAALDEEQIQIVEELEVLENFELLADLELLEDFEAIERLPLANGA